MKMIIAPFIFQEQCPFHEIRSLQLLDALGGILAESHHLLQQIRYSSRLATSSRPYR